MTPKVGIVLINYKTYAKRFLEDCRDSMRKINYPRDKYVVYIVDNATSPETEAYLREMYPEAVILPNKENSGWGGGNNVGIAQAFKDGCEDIVLSNMDVIVQPQWLRELVAAAYSEEHNPPQPSLILREGDRSEPPLRVRGGRGSYDNRPIGIVQSKLLLWPVGKDGVQRINSVGNQIHFLGFGYCKGYGDIESTHNPSQPPLTLRGGEIEDIPYASGASMYVRRAVFEKIGLCNPDFFMYHDDMELCLKAKLAGYRVVFAPKSIMWHKYEFKRSILQVYYMERNRLLTMLQFYKVPTLILIAPAFFAMELGVLSGAILGGYAKPKLRSWGYFFKPSSWRKIARERRAIQAMRTMSDRSMMRDFTGQILFQEVMNPVLKYIANPAMNAYWQINRRVMFW
ncbi:glycosyltransferase family 2 protein [Candidatus Uhrbacteria bacterium]|nr:glycosyltransferase family 2 protein [Candidatus Uhrbacteria bacterium]